MLNVHKVSTPALRGWMLALLVLALGGCAPTQVARDLPLLDAPPPLSESGQAPVADQWWTAFGDPALNARIAEAMGHNYTLESALQRVAAARAVADREASDLFPDLNGIMGFDSDFGPGENQTRYAWGLDASYQVDLWGEIDSRVHARQLAADATWWEYQTIALSLSAEIARTWFSLIEANAQYDLLQEQIKTNRTGLQLQESRFGLGLIRSADVLRQRQLLESTLEQSVVAELQIEVLEHQLAVLLGEMPQSATYQTGSVLPQLPPVPMAGLPLELIQRRPDVRRDFLAFEAADQDLASAISAQYPRLNLSGALINSAENPEDLLKDWFASLGGQLIAPLLDGGQRRAQVDLACAVKQQLFSACWAE